MAAGYARFDPGPFCRALFNRAKRRHYRLLQEAVESGETGSLSSGTFARCLGYDSGPASGLRTAIEAGSA